MADDPRETHDTGAETHSREAGTSRRASFRPPNLAELPDRILALLRKSPAAEIEHQLRSVVSATITKLDLVTRDEFEIQQALIDDLRARIEALEVRAGQAKAGSTASGTVR